MTAEELLAAMAEPLAEDGTYCTIDPETRVITIPPEYQLLGVESDEKAERIYFKCPKIVGDNIDLSKLALRVNFRNAGQAVDQYLVDDVAVDGDNITFSWLLSRRVTQYEGDVNFIVCAVRVSGETITNEWNTTLATAQVLEGLEVEVVLPEEETDIVNQLLALAETRLNDARDATSAANTAASNANQKAQEAENAAEDARGVIEQITKDSYLHTALQSFIDTVTATPTAYGNAVVKKIEGFTRQRTTTGAQLFDASGLISYGGATFSVLNDGKDVRVTGKKNDSTKGSVVWIMPAEIVNLIKGKTIYTYVNHNAVSGWVEYGIRTSSGSTYPIVKNGQWTAIEIPSDVVGVQLALIPNDETETDVTATFSDIKIGLTQFETWEPYTGRQPAPNPDYLMVVQGNGKYGFWDGKFENGSYNAATGNPESGTNYIRCLNDIVYPLKSGDKIKFIYEKPVNIGIFLFDKQGVLTYASSSKFAEWEYTVTKDQERFRFFILDRDGVNAETAKHLTITINGKYALCIKSEGINLCSGVEVGAYLHTNGLPTADGGYRRSRTKRMLVKPSTTYKESCNTNSTLTKTVLFYDEKLNFIKYQPLTGTIQTPDNCAYMAINYYSGGSEPDVRDVIITESAKFPEEFIPYQGDVTYIPVDYPLFEGDKIIQRNGEYKLVRYHGIEIADGTTDWYKNSPSDPNDYAYYRSKKPIKDTTKAIYCDRLRKIPNEEKTVGIFMNTYYPKAIYVRLDADLLPTNDAEHFKQWLSENPLTIIYPLDTPTEEPLSPEAQKALHSIMAADEQTELTIVGIPADASIQNQFLLPRNEDGALNTTAYCTSVKNKLTLDELLSQSLDSRVNKLEIDNATLAEQTIIVE